MCVLPAKAEECKPSGPGRELSGRSSGLDEFRPDSVGFARAEEEGETFAGAGGRGGPPSEGNWSSVAEGGGQKEKGESPGRYQ